MILDEHWMTLLAIIAGTIIGVSIWLYLTSGVRGDEKPT